MKLVELYLLLLMFSIGATTPCLFYEGSYSCRNLRTSDYPLKFPRLNDTFSMVIDNTVNLPNNAITGIQLEKLVIRNSDITSIAENAFNGHEDTLKVLHISTQVQQVQAPMQSLVNLYNLEELEIKKFQLNPTFNNMNFANLSRLQSLHIEENGLKLLEDAVFKGLSALTSLTIKLNDFERIPLPPVLGDLNLTNLDMSDNKIVKITGYVFTASKNLKQIILTQNAISEIEEDAFIGLEDRLEELDFRLNRLNSAQLINIAELRSLRKLDLQSNRIISLPKDVFKNFHSLQELNLKINQLSKLSNGSLLGLSSLKILKLDDPDIAVEAGTLLDTPLLQEISFKTKHKLLPMEWLEDARSLQKVTLDGSTINATSLWIAIQSLKKLSYLSLSNCKLGSIPEFAFAQNRQLEYLSLSNCELAYIADFAFEQNGKLKKLKLDNNKLQVLKQETLQGLQGSLTSIDLQENELVTIDECVFQDFNLSLKQELFPINLDKNKFVCNCSLLWLQEWIQIYLAHQDNPDYPYSNVNRWKCDGSKIFYKTDLNCDTNSTNNTCQDFRDRYTTMMAPTTTIYTTEPDVTTEILTTEETTTLKTTTTTVLPSTTTMPSTTTTPTTAPSTTPPTTTPTPVIPTLFLLLEKLSSSSVSISWKVSSWKHVKKLTLMIDKSGDGIDVTETLIVLSQTDSTTKILSELPKGTILNVCIRLKLNFPSSLLDKCDRIRLLMPQKVVGEKVGVKVGIGVGVAVLVTLILSLLGLMCYNRRQSKDLIEAPKPEAVAAGSVNDPRMTPKTKRYKKRKSPENDPQVSVISVEPFQPMPRISAGSYQYLADPNLGSNSAGVSHDPNPGFYDNKAFSGSIHEYNVVDETEKNQGGYDNKAFTGSIHEYNVVDETEKSQPGAGHDNKAFTDITQNSKIPEKNNNENRSSTERPLPNLPGSKSFSQYFEPEEPIYSNAESHYAEIPHTETTI